MGVISVTYFLLFFLSTAINLLANVNSRSRSLYVIALPSVCLSVCNVRAPYSGNWNFCQCFYAVWHVGQWPSLDIQVKFYGDRPRGTPSMQSTHNAVACSERNPGPADASEWSSYFIFYSLKTVVKRLYFYHNLAEMKIEMSKKKVKSWLLKVINESITPILPLLAYTMSSFRPVGLQWRH